MGKVINAFRAVGGLPPVSSRADAGRPVARPGTYLDSLGGAVLTGLSPILREPFDDVSFARSMAAQLAVTAIHNSGWMSGGVDTAVAQMNGNGLQIALKPAPDVIGTPQATRDWARKVEQRWYNWSANPYQCDLGGRYSVGQLAHQACRQMFGTGEILATLPYKKKPGNTHGTKVNLLPSTRLAKQADVLKRIVDGVQLDGDYAPIGYLITQRDLTTEKTSDLLIGSRDVTGRPVVIHLFDGAPTALRGITPLVPALKVVQQYDQLANATLVAELIRAIFTATIESESPTADVLRALQNVDEADEEDPQQVGGMNLLQRARAGWYANTNFDLGEHGKIVHTFPGEKLSFNNNDGVSSTYEGLAKGLLREIARCMGITYEQLTGDWVGATYSSIRMAIADIWLINLYRRAYFPARFNQMIFEAWLEEDIEIGGTPFPGGIDAFIARRDEVCQADWRGPPRPTADDLKTAKAQQIQRAEGWVPTEQLSAEYGNDWRDVQEQQKVEDEERERLGLEPLPHLGGGGNGAGSAAVDDSGKPKPKPGGDKPTPEEIARDARLVSALMRDDPVAVEAVLVE